MNLKQAMAPIEELQLFENRLRTLAGQKRLDDAFEQAKREHQHLADQADALLLIKQKLEIQGFS